MNLLVVLLAFHFLSVRADLTCLGWALINPFVGLFCTFEPQDFSKAANQTVSAVEQAVQDGKDLINFDLTHNPVSITYNFIENTQQGGLDQGRQYLSNISGDYKDVTIGFAEGTVNSAVTLYDYVDWTDVSTCVIYGAYELVAQQKQKRTDKRASLPSSSDARTMAQGCLNDKLKKIANPAVFHPNGTNQKVGATISEIALLLVPVDAEEEVAAKAAEVAGETVAGAVDLAILGSEASTRVFKDAGEGTAVHFADGVEAQAVADKMKDDSWLKENCGVCGSSPAPLADALSRRHRRYRKGRRANIANACCKLPTDLSSSLTTAAAERKIIEDTDKLWDFVPEDELISAPQLIERDVSVDSDVEGLANDLYQSDTGLVKWSSKLSGIMSSDKMLASLEKMFKGEDGPLRQAMKVSEREKGLRLTSFSGDWIWERDPTLKPFQNFVNTAVEQGIEVVKKVKKGKFHPGQEEMLGGNVEFFYVPPSEKALTGVDARPGFHTDNGQMQFGIANVPGLVVKNSVTKAAFRVPLEKDGFHLLKAHGFDTNAYFNDLQGGPTFHAVYGQEMAQKGRVSIIMSIYTKGSPVSRRHIS